MSDKRKVVLTPTELHTCTRFTNDSQYLCLFAGLWNIDSSDMEVHKIFCSLAIKFEVFQPSRGVCDEKDVPSTFDDGSENTMWFNKLFCLCQECKRQGIQVEINLSKKTVSEYGINHNYVRSYNNTSTDILINTYFTVLITLAETNRCQEFIKSRSGKSTKIYKWFITHHRICFCYPDTVLKSLR